jgi:Cu2+-containing amine oxidase
LEAVTSDYIDSFVKKHGKNTLDNIVQKTIEAVVSELKKNKLLKSNEQTAFQKTEILLYNYTNFKNAIDQKFQQIEVIKEEGLIEKSKSITSYVNNAYYESTNDYHKAEEMIESIYKAIRETQKYIDRIDAALKHIQDDPYFDIIRLKYFEGKTREELADHFYVDVRTISRNKNRLINLLQIQLFTEDIMFEIMGLR